MLYGQGAVIGREDARAVAARPATLGESVATASKATARALRLGFQLKWQAGVCARCGGPTVKNFRKVGGVGILTVEECWLGLDEKCEDARADRLRSAA